MSKSKGNVSKILQIKHGSNIIFFTFIHIIKVVLSPHTYMFVQDLCGQFPINLSLGCYDIIYQKFPFPLNLLISFMSNKFYSFNNFILIKSKASRPFIPIMKEHKLTYVTYSQKKSIGQ